MGQTILSFDQNFLKRLENAMQIENNHYINDSIGHIVLPPIQFLKFDIAFNIENSMSL